MLKNKTMNRQKILVATLIFLVLLVGLIGRLVFFMVLQSEYYSQKAQDLHVRERYIKAKRGKILDRNGVILADNLTTASLIIIPNQIKDADDTSRKLAEILNVSKEEMEYQSEISAIYSLITNEELLSRPYPQVIKPVYERTLALFSGLKKLNTNIKKYIEYMVLRFY